MESSRYGLRYNLWGKPRSKSKFTHQLITSSGYLNAVILDFCSEINGFWKVILVKRYFSVWHPQFSKIFEIIWIKYLRIKQCPFSTLSIMKAKQYYCVNSQLDLKVPLRLLLRPHLLDTDDSFRIFGQDTDIQSQTIAYVRSQNHLSLFGTFDLTISKPVDIGISYIPQKKALLLLV